MKLVAYLEASPQGTNISGHGRFYFPSMVFFQDTFLPVLRVVIEIARNRSGQIPTRLAYKVPLVIPQ